MCPFRASALQSAENLLKGNQLRAWRQQLARKLVFGASQDPSPVSRMRFLILIATSCLLAMHAPAAYAADTGAQNALGPTAYRYITDSHGFVLAVPDVEPEKLASEIRDVRRALKARREHINRASKIGPVDVLIAVVAPGGLAYAGYKLMMMADAKDKVAALNDELDMLGRDLLEFEDIGGHAFLALASHGSEPSQP